MIVSKCKTISPPPKKVGIFSIIDEADIFPEKYDPLLFRKMKTYLSRNYYFTLDCEILPKRVFLLALKQYCAKNINYQRQGGTPMTS